MHFSVHIKTGFCCCGVFPEAKMGTHVSLSRCSLNHTDLNLWLPSPPKPALHTHWTRGTSFICPFLCIPMGVSRPSPLRLDSPHWPCPSSLEKEKKVHWFCQPSVCTFTLWRYLSRVTANISPRDLVKLWYSPTVEYYAAMNKWCHGRVFKTWENV